MEPLKRKAKNSKSMCQITSTWNIVTAKFVEHKNSCVCDKPEKDIAISRPVAEDEYTPGMEVYKVIDFVYSKKNKEEIFDSILADSHKEYFTAKDDGRMYKMRWIAFKTYYFLFYAAVTFMPMKLIAKVTSIIKQSNN